MEAHLRKRNCIKNLFIIYILPLSIKDIKLNVNELYTKTSKQTLILILSN